MSHFFSRLSFRLRRHPSSPSRLGEMRSHWTAAASALGLRHLSGGPFAEADARFRDVLIGSVSGQHILVRYLSNFDVQKPETLIQVASEVPLVAPDLDRQGLVAHCATLGVALDPETAEWFLGHRNGIGTCLSGGVLVYRQLYEMSADQLIRLISAMTSIMPHLGRTPTGRAPSGGGRVDRGGVPPRSPTDPDVRDYRIRLFESRLRGATDSTSRPRFLLSAGFR